MSVQVQELDDWALVQVHGDVDVGSAPRLREQLIAVISNGQANVVLDLDDVAFMDSTGLGVIVGVLKRARTHGGDLRLVCTRPPLQRLFEITGLDRTMPLAESAAAAVAGAGTEG